MELPLHLNKRVADANDLFANSSEVGVVMLLSFDMDNGMGGGSVVNSVIDGLRLMIRFVDVDNVIIYIVWMNVTSVDMLMEMRSWFFFGTVGRGERNDRSLDDGRSCIAMINFRWAFCKSDHSSSIRR
jgi:hypothetical protein